MGLDLVEIMMAMEEEFGVDIVASELPDGPLTPKFIGDHVWARLGQAGEATCPSRRAFHSLRRELVNTLGIRRQEITPATRLDVIFPAAARHRSLSKLRNNSELGLRVLRLRRPAWMTWTILTVSSALAILAAHCTGNRIGSTPSKFLGFTLFPLISIVLAYGSRHWRNRFPTHITQLRHLVPMVSADTGREWTRRDVDCRIEAIIVEQLGVTPDQVRPEADLIRDLGAG